LLWLAVLALVSADRTAGVGQAGPAAWATNDAVMVVVVEALANVGAQGDMTPPGVGPAQAP
jgi:hypothetical protein